MSNKSNKTTGKELPLAEQIASVAAQLNLQSAPSEEVIHQNDGYQEKQAWDPRKAIRGFMTNLYRTFPEGFGENADLSGLLEDFTLELGLYLENPEAAVKAAFAENKKSSFAKLLHPAWYPTNDDKFLGVTPINRAHDNDETAVRIARVDVAVDGASGVVDLTYTMQYGARAGKEPHVYSFDKLAYLGPDPDVVSKDLENFPVPLGTVMSLAFLHALAPVADPRHKFNDLASFCERNKFSFDPSSSEMYPEFKNLPANTLISFNPRSLYNMYSEPEIMGKTPSKDLTLPFWESAFAFIKKETTKEDGSPGFHFEKVEIQAEESRLFTVNPSMTLWLKKDQFSNFEHHKDNMPFVETNVEKN